MGLTAIRRREESAASGELCPIEALDRSGLLVTSDGAFVRYLRVGQKNPLVLSDGERTQLSDAFGQLAGRLRAGQALQFYVEAAPVQLDSLLARTRAEAERAATLAEEDGSPEQAAALRGLRQAHEQSLALHADDLAAIDRQCYVVVPYLPSESRFGFDWRALLRRPAQATLSRALESHRRFARESLRLADKVRGDLEALDLATDLLSGPQVADLIWRRFNPTTAQRSPERAPAARPATAEIVGELDVRAEAEDAAQAASALRSLIAEAEIDFRDKRRVEIDRALVQTIAVGSMPDATFFGWLLGMMQVPKPFALSVHVHALDRVRERARHKARHRRLFGINRGAELRGRIADYESIAQEDEEAEVVKELSGHERAALYDVSIYPSICELGPAADARELAEAVDEAARELTAASDARIEFGQFARQRDLWESSLPLGRDVARRTHQYMSRHVGDTIPLIGTSCGSPAGIPFAFAEPGRTIELLNPWDPAHECSTMLVHAKSGAGKTMFVATMAARLLAHGASGFVIDRAGHYEFLTKLVPGSRHIQIGTSDEGSAVNPWDTPDQRHPPIEKIGFLVGLHALLVGDHRAGDDSYGLDPLERNLLEVAIRAVYEKAATAGIAARESLLRDELRRRAQDEAKAGAAELAARLRSLAERLESFCGEGSYAYLLDRETTVEADSRLIAFDTRNVPRELSAAVLFVLAEHVTGQVERRRAQRLESEPGGLFIGQSFLVLEEVWKLVERRATGEWINDLARRGRHLGLFLIAVSQLLSDFAGEWGKALMRNATMQAYFRQAVEELGYAAEEQRLTAQEVEHISRLKTVKRRYAQAYIVNGTRGRGTVSVRLSPREYWLATSDPIRDVPERQRALAEHGGDAWAALDALAAQGLETNE